jgi:NADH-quinone oxidoreductase subunit L
MTLPLIVLGVGSVIAGFVSVPPLVGASWLREKWLGRSVTELPLERLSHGTEVGLILASVLVAVAGLFLSWRLYGKKGLAAEAALREGLSRLYELMADAFRVDKLYDKTIVRSYEILADAAKDLAGQLTGRFLPSAIGMVIEKAGMALQRLQVGYVPAYIAYLVAGGLLLLLIWLNWA